MKNFRKFLRNLTLFVLFLSTTMKLVGQEKINISAGLGLPDLVNVGVRYQLSQSQLGISAGMFQDATAITGDYYQHLFGSSKFSERHSFYTRVGMTYFRAEDDTSIDQYLFLAIRFGRDFNLSKTFGFQLDVGVPLEIMHDQTKKENYKSSPFSIDFDMFIPAFGLSVFYRL